MSNIGLQCDSNEQLRPKSVAHMSNDGLERDYTKNFILVELLVHLSKIDENDCSHNNDQKTYSCRFEKNFQIFSKPYDGGH